MGIWIKKLLKYVFSFQKQTEFNFQRPTKEADAEIANLISHEEINEKMWFEPMSSDSKAYITFFLPLSTDFIDLLYYQKLELALSYTW